MKPTRPIARLAVAAAALLTLVASGCDDEPYDTGSVGGNEQTNGGEDTNGDGSGDGDTDDGEDSDTGNDGSDSGNDGGNDGGNGGDGTAAELAAELEAATNAFYDSLTQAYADLDPAAIEAVSAQDCQHCRDYAASVSEMAESGQEFAETGAYELSNFEVVQTPSDDDAGASVALDRRHTGLTIVDETGSTVQESEEETVRVQLRFRHVDGQWLVLEELYLS